MQDVHPKYYKDAKITCSCGNIILAGSTKETLKTELCSACHPFFTGQQKLVDTAGMVDKFRARQQATQKVKEKKESEKQAQPKRTIEEKFASKTKKIKKTAKKKSMK